MTPEQQSPENPSFDEPPVIETALGVTFQRLEELTNAHLGAYWVGMGDDWPHVEDSRPVERQLEELDGPWLEVQRGVRLSQDPSSRLAIFRSDRSRAIQLQQSGFDFSWIKKTGEIYPRYAPVKAEFDREWERFCAFAAQHEFNRPELLQWEITYVNKIPEGTLWNSPDDWPALFSTSFGIPWPKSDLASLESFSTQWHFQIPDRRGRLHVRIAHAKHEGDNALMLVLTARGAVDEQQDWGLSAGLDLGRMTIVNYFKQITSELAHKSWKIES